MKGKITYVLLNIEWISGSLWMKHGWPIGFSILSVAAWLKTERSIRSPLCHLMLILYVPCPLNKRDLTYKWIWNVYLFLGEFVAQFKFTVLLQPNMPVKITGSFFDHDCYKSSLKVTDEKLLVCNIFLCFIPYCNSRILKANSSWSLTWAKFCQLPASLSVVLSQPDKTQTWVPEVRLLEKKDTNTDKNIFASLKFDFFRVQLKFDFRIRP